MGNTFCFSKAVPLRAFLKATAFHFTIKLNSGYVNKQELYFVKGNYEFFSTEVSAREKHGQNSGGPHQGVIGSLGISSAVRPF